MGWQDAPVVGDAPSANPVTPTAAPQAAQADVRKVDQRIMPSGKRRSLPGDAGAAIGAGEAFGAINRAWDRLAYNAGGKVTDAATAMGLPPEAAAGAGYATNVGVGAVPMLLGGEGAVATKVPETLRKGGLSVMQSALKPSKFENKSGKGLQAAETMLKEGVNVTEGGVEKLTKSIDKLDDELERVIASSKGQVDKIDALKPIKVLLARFKEQVGPNADLQTIRAAAKEFWNHPLLRGQNTMSVEQAQALKRGTYRQLGSKSYGPGLNPAAGRDADKAMAHGLMTGIERAESAAGPLNAQMAPLINARNIAQERVLASGNKNPLGWGVLNPKTMPVALADRSELAKSLLARGMYSGAEAIPRTAGQLTGAALGAYEETPPRR